MSLTFNVVGKTKSTDIFCRHSNLLPNFTQLFSFSGGWEGLNKSEHFENTSTKIDAP